MNFVRRSSVSSLLAFALVSAVSLAVAGCSFESAPNAGSVGSAEFAGIIHGGPNPVIGATVRLYATQSNGYGGAGLQLATATTNSSGGFSFNASSYTCPAGQQAYITAAGGNTGSNTTNSQAVLMAAIGPCSTLNSSTFIWIDEPSTVAAAYALSNFITITGTGASTVVNVSAPANNNATTGSCTGTGTAMTCKAAGLAHAFLNAANLVNAVGTVSAQPTGAAYLTPPSNPTTNVSSTTSPALLNTVPQQLINSLADSVESCVNSGGGVAGDGSACGTLFTNTTVSSTYTASSTYTTAPTNTLQALVNLAKFPFTNVAGVYGVAAGNSYYQPTLTAAPQDWSIAVIYRSTVNGTLPIGASYYTTTDINDNVYTSSLTVPATGSSTGAAPLYLQALSSNGAGNWTSVAQIAASSSYICSQTGSSTAGTQTPCISATDTAGNLWFGNGSLAYTGGGLYQVSTASGAVTSYNTAVSGTTYYPFALAVDRNNDLFYSSANTTGTANVWTLPAGSTATTVPTPVAPGGTNWLQTHIPDAIAFDTAGNFFGPYASGSNVGYAYFANTGTLSAEAFGTAGNNCNCLGGSIDSLPTGAMVDGSGNFWMGTNTTFVKLAGPATAQAITGGGSSGLSVVTMTNASAMRVASMDGAGTIFAPDGVTPTVPVLRMYYSGLTTPAQASIASCNVGTATGNTACIATNFGAPNGGVFYKSVNAAIDSTGSLWVSSYGNDAVIQVLGVAAPTWPQASYLHPGVMPQ